MRNLLPAVAIPVIFIALFCRTAGPEPPPTARPVPPVYPMEKQIGYGFTLQNTTAAVLKSARLWVRAPVKRTSTQLTLAIDASHPHALLTDGLGNQVLCFAFENLPPFAARIIRIRAGLRLASEPNPLPEANLAGYLAPSPFIQSGHPRVVAAAAGLKRADPPTTAAACFAWVAEHVRYAGFDGREKGALYALIHQEGDCTEFADLFAALCRAQGIPARIVGGYVCPESRLLSPHGYHNWAEFHAGGLWHLADPQKGNFMARSSEYIAMRIPGPAEPPEMRFDRFRSEGEGLKAAMHTW